MYTAKKNPVKQAQLHHILVSTSMRDIIETISSKPGYRSDNSIIAIADLPVASPMAQIFQAGSLIPSLITLISPHSLQDMHTENTYSFFAMNM